MAGIERAGTGPVVARQDDRGSEVLAAQGGALPAATWDSARIAANPRQAEERAMAGFENARGLEQGGADARRRADAPGSVQTALTRPFDESRLPAQGSHKEPGSQLLALTDDARLQLKREVHTVLLNLGNAIEDHRFDPNTSGKFREQLDTLARAHPESSDFKGALAHLRAASQVLDQATLAPGTKLAFDPEFGTNLTSTGLPSIGTQHLDADLYYKTADGTLHVDSSKSSVNAVVTETQRTLKAKDLELTQSTRHLAWRQSGSPEEPRRVGVNAMDASANFHGLMDDRHIGVVKDTVGNPSERSIILGSRRYSPNDLDRIDDAAKRALPGYVEDARKAHVAAGLPESTFKAPYGDIVRETMPTPEAAMKNFGVKVGEAVPSPKTPPAFDMPTAQQGGLLGGLTSAGISTGLAVLDGKITAEEARTIGRDTAVGAATGAVTAAGERAVAPAIDRAVGQSIQASATRVAANTLGQSAASAVTTGAMTRTLATRALGATGVGAVVATGISAYENRGGLARGDSKAIGNVAADTVVAAGSIVAATATGAAVGSVVPVAGTLIGGTVGLAVGVGVAFGAQISGARDWMAEKAGGAVDWVKSWF